MLGRRRLIQLCPRCQRLVDAELVLEWNDGGHLVADRSTCRECGTVLWNWRRSFAAPPAVFKPKKEQLSLF